MKGVISLVRFRWFPSPRGALRLLIALLLRVGEWDFESPYSSSSDHPYCNSIEPSCAERSAKGQTSKDIPSTGAKSTSVYIQLTIYLLTQHTHTSTSLNNPWTSDLTSFSRPPNKKPPTPITSTPRAPTARQLKEAREKRGGPEEESY
jgi:hypothetical protein